MFVLDIPANPNCDAVEMRVFNDLSPPTPVARVRLEREQGTPAWFAITGWTVAGAPCPALMRKVDDSGEGVALLISGGDAGLRLQPADRRASWSVADAAQWGEPFLLLADAADLQFVDDGPR